MEDSEIIGEDGWPVQEYIVNIEEKEKHHISADAALANIKTSLVSYPSDPKLLSLYIQLLRNEIPFRTFLEKIGEG